MSEHLIGKVVRVIPGEYKTFVCNNRGDDQELYGTLERLREETATVKFPYALDGSGFISQTVWHDQIPELKTNAVRLNDEYEAIIEDGQVRVGCQHFDFDRVLELAEKIKERR